MSANRRSQSGGELDGGTSYNPPVNNEYESRRSGKKDRLETQKENLSRPSRGHSDENSSGEYRSIVDKYHIKDETAQTAQTAAPATVQASPARAMKRASANGQRGEAQISNKDNNEDDQTQAEKCEEILKTSDEDEETTGTTSAQPDAQKKESTSFFGSIIDYIFGIVSSSYWPETDKERCKRIFEKGESNEEGTNEVAQVPESVERPITAAQVPESVERPPTPTQGGRRYTHKNREGRKKTRKQ